jgi:hypothetical protein
MSRFDVWTPYEVADVLDRPGFSVLIDQEADVTLIPILTAGCRLLFSLVVVWCCLARVGRGLVCREKPVAGWPDDNENRRVLLPRGAPRPQLCVVRRDSAAIELMHPRQSLLERFT